MYILYLSYVMDFRLNAQGDYSEDNTIIGR